MTPPTKTSNKLKEKILKMSKDELIKEEWSDRLDIKENNKDEKGNEDCSYCFDCSNCSHCSHCSYCYNLANGLYCRNLKLEKRDYDKYYICNVEISKEEFEQKKKELEE